MSAVVRMAFFEGALRPGGEADFFAYVDTRLVPLWTRFPQLVSFRMRMNAWSEDGAPPFVLILEFTYPSRTAMEHALASPIRAESREVTKGLFEFFDGRISHIVADAADFPTVSGI